METEKVVTKADVKDDQGRFVLQRGPIVYCLEGPDNKDNIVQNIVVSKAAPVDVTFEASLLNGVNVLSAKGESTKRQLNSEILLTSEQQVKAIPYYTWANRGPSDMMVWIPYEASAVYLHQKYIGMMMGPGEDAVYRLLIKFTIRKGRNGCLSKIPQPMNLLKTSIM